MQYNAKTSITSWWILALMAFFLWYRNENYDRALAIFIFTLGLTQLIEYGIYSGTDPIQSGRALFIILWLQCLVLAIGVYIFINDLYRREGVMTTTTQNIIHTIAGWNLFLFGIIFVISLIMTYVTSTNTFYAAPNSDGHVDTFMNNQPMMQSYGWLYGVGILVPLLLLFGYYMWADIGIAILIIYGALAAAYILTYYPLSSAGSMWSYVSVGIAFLGWGIGLLPTKLLPDSSTHSEHSIHSELSHSDPISSYSELPSINSELPSTHSGPFLTHSEPI